ncbi:MAG TPA: DinB family protein [Micromonosporaceae bacterium]|jgi:hypothetical protein
MTTWTAPDRQEAPIAPDGERASLESWLDYHRDTLLLKCAGLAPEQLCTRSCEPSTLSLLGLVRHMTEVEAWFQQFDGAPRPELYCTDEFPDGEFDNVDPALADEDLGRYRAAIERSRAAVAGLSLDQLEAPENTGPNGPHSLRWIYQHMIEEYARHNGHADLLRERIDGATGD